MSSRKRYCKWQNNQTPNRTWVKLDNRQEKTNYKRQLLKYLANPEYEIIQQGYRHSAKWAYN